MFPFATRHTFPLLLYYIYTNLGGIKMIDTEKLLREYIEISINKLTDEEISTFIISILRYKRPHLNDATSYLAYIKIYHNERYNKIFNLIENGLNQHNIEK